MIQSLIHSILSKNIHNCDELSGTTHHAPQSLNLNYSPRNDKHLNVGVNTVEVKTLPELISMQGNGAKRQKLTKAALVEALSKDRAKY